jgi:hypothetical protein
MSKRCWWQHQIDTGKQRAEKLGHCEHLTQAVTTKGVTCCVCSKELTKAEAHQSGKQFAKDG